MLTVQPKLTSQINSQSFTSRFGDKGNVDYVMPADSYYPGIDDFDIDFEKEQSRQELDLWEQTKHNLDSIAKTTEQVPVLKTGTKIMSGLISVAIGWGGLRWGTVGTLEVLSKIGKTRLAKAVKGYASTAQEYAADLFGRGKTFVKDTNFYKSAVNKLTDMKQAVLDTKAGQKYSDIKSTVKGNKYYQKAVGYKNDGVAYIKNLNPKRVFVETMGVAGGGTAAVNTLGGKTIDGSRHIVEPDDNGGYIVDGREYAEEYRYAS